MGSGIVHITFGHDVRLGVVKPPLPTRVLMAPNWYWPKNYATGNSGFEATSPGGYDCYDLSKAWLGKAVEWLTGKSSGASMLIFDSEAGTTIASYFRQALGELGHSYTLTGATGNHGGYDPLDFDCFINVNEWTSGTYQGYTNSTDKLNYVLDNGGHWLWVWNAWGDTIRDALGFDTHGWKSTSGHTYRLREVTGGMFGAGTYYLPFYTTQYLTETTPTRTGSRSVDFCDVHASEGCWGFYWEDET